MSQQDRLRRYLTFIKSEDELYEIEERLAIMQYDGGLSCEFATYLALKIRFREKNHPDLVKLGYYPPDFFNEDLYWQKKPKH